MPPDENISLSQALWQSYETKILSGVSQSPRGDGLFEIVQYLPEAVQPCRAQKDNSALVAKGLAVILAIFKLCCYMNYSNLLQYLWTLDPSLITLRIDLCIFYNRTQGVPNQSLV